MTRVFVSLAVLAATASALAQSGGGAITWRTDPKQAINEATAANRPLMVYVLGATKDRDNHIEREQKRALEDPRVVRLAQKFVALKLSRSEHRDILKDFGLPESANMIMSFVAPDGQKLDELGAGGIAQVDSLLAKLNGALKAYGRRVYDTAIKPKLEDPDAKPVELKEALRLVVQFDMTMADQDVIKLLEREGLDAALRGQIYDTLAALSTQTAVTKLLDASRNQAVAATKALEKCSPVAAEQLLAELVPDGETFDYSVYKAITKICSVRDVKPERWFETAKVPAKTQEIERVRKLVTEKAKSWKETHDAAG